MKWTAAVLGLFIVSGALAAELVLPQVFADHMVLQRGQAVPVWGTADAGASVTVEFAGQEKSTTADADGQWRVDLNPLSASAESRILKVSSNHQSDIISHQFTDVLVGEVWLCGGQSNMDFSLKKLRGKARNPHYEPAAEYLRQEIQTANDPLFRHFKVGRNVSVYAETASAPGQWISAVPGEVQDFSGTGYFFGRELRRELDVPVALLSCNWGGTRVEPWIPMSYFQADAAMEKYYAAEMDALKKKMAAWDDDAEAAKFAEQLAAWEAKAAEAKVAGKSAPRKPRAAVHPEQNQQLPSSLYNGMIRSLVPYGIKGVIWYQGESNAQHYPEAYADRFSTLIDAWRERWGQEQLFFYWCQLANYKQPNREPLGDEEGWAVVCDAQRRVTAKPYTGMAVLNDIGEAEDVHPKNKADAGKRLSLWALNQAYGRDAACSGPLYKSAEKAAGKVIITFDHAGAGLMVGHKHLMEPAVEVDEPLKRFQICGADGDWKWAEAEIIGKDQVAVWHDEIAEPAEVRYAWSSNPEGANLYNKAGLPASVFKTGRL